METLVRTDLDRLWELTHDTASHPRWDARFSAITPTGTTPDGAWPFRYELRLLVTGYDDEPGWGRLLDALGVRRFVGWLTAWSFDRLRIWAETGTAPEAWPWWSVLQVWRPDRPRASRCRRAPRRGGAMDASPATLARLESP